MISLPDSSSGGAQMDRGLLEAAISGDSVAMKLLASRDPDVILGTTPEGNTCLHIASIHGHKEFCNDAMSYDMSLLSAVNADEETPLLTAVKRGHVSLASVLLARCLDQELSDAILKKDKQGCNALHHALRSGHRELALELIAAEPALTKAVNSNKESPMFIAVMRESKDVFEILLEIPESAHSGAIGFNALHAAVIKGNPDIARRLMETRPWLVREESENKQYTPMHLAAYEGKVNVVTALLEDDPSLGYLISTNGAALLCIAASQGHVAVARELLKHCPDAPYTDSEGRTCLHVAVLSEQLEFVDFVLGCQQLQHLINMANSSGETALHLAARNSQTKMVDALMLHQDIDVTMLDKDGNHAKALTSMEGETDDSSSSSEGDGSSSGEIAMDRRLLEAAIIGDAASMEHLVSNDPTVLDGSTPQGYTCLHIASIHGHKEFCKDALALNPSLLHTVNSDGETPLVTAINRGHISLALILLTHCLDQQLSAAILKKDKQGCNALHHALLGGHREFALELIAAEPTLSQAVNNNNESPMFIAVVRDFTDVLEKLLENASSAHSGADGWNALHAAVINAIAKRLMETRPLLAREENEKKYTPIHQAAYEGKVDVLTVLLEHDPSLGYLISTNGATVLCIAASQGHVGVARALLRHCPDAPYTDNAAGYTCLHLAVLKDEEEFVKFVVGSQQLRHLINMTDSKRETALHLAARKGKSEIVAALKFHGAIDAAKPTNHAKPFISVAGAFEKDARLLEAATTGDAITLQNLVRDDPGLLCGTTPQGNTCLHIASIHGHEAFCKAALALRPSLLGAVNADCETPLLSAVTSGRVSVASVLLRSCRDLQMSEAILIQDSRGFNVLHHAIRNGHRKLALELITAESALSQAVNKYNESPMFIAVMRNYEDVFEKLLEIPDSAHGGANGFNALHAAVRNGKSAIAEKIMERRSGLAKEENEDKNTPMHLAVLWDKVDVLRVLLEHDRSLGYVVSSDDGTPLLVSAAYRGHVGVARELLKHCPDPPYCDNKGETCLHVAVWNHRMEFVKFILGTPKLRKLVNMQSLEYGDTALHQAVEKCNPKVVASLLLHQDTDVTVLNNKGDPAIWALSDATDHAKTINWNEVSMRMLKADPQDAGSIYNLHKDVKDKVTDSSRKDIKSLTQTYTGNTSLVAILIATITFAAAFTLPGGYSNDAGNEGLPIMTRNVAFQAFLVSDTLAMCSSLAVAFICVIAKWEDLEFLLYYRSFTKKLMWFAYMATTTAFATGLYTILAPRLLWLAVTICVLTSLLPILTKLLGEWPVLKLRFRLGGKFKSEFLDMV